MSLSSWLVVNQGQTILLFLPLIEQMSSNAHVSVVVYRQSIVAGRHPLDYQACYLHTVGNPWSLINLILMHYLHQRSLGMASNDMA